MTVDVNSQANFKIICRLLELFSTVANHASNQDPKLSTTEKDREMVATRTWKSTANAFAYLIQVIAHESIEHKYMITDMFYVRCSVFYSPNKKDLT